MFVGHLAVALAGKRLTPKLSLGWLIAAATTADLLWPILVLAGVEQVRIAPSAPGATAFTPLVFDSYPWSHSLLMLALWGFALGVFASRAGGDRRILWLIAALVVSHWILDYITHAPDMPLWPGSSPRYGLALWNSIPATLVVEGLLWGTCLTSYIRGRTARSWKGRLAFWSLVLVTTALWALGPFMAPPPSVQALAWFALIGGLLTVPWAIWADRGYVERTA